MTGACDWEEVNSFRSLEEYERILALVKKDVQAGQAISVELDPSKRWGTAFDEHWFKCVRSGQVWRLIGPDPPFRGLFKPLGD